MVGVLVAQVGHLEGHAEGVGQSLRRLHLDLSLGLGLGALHHHGRTHKGHTWSYISVCTSLSRQTARRMSCMWDLHGPIAQASLPNCTLP